MPTLLTHVFSFSAFSDLSRSTVLDLTPEQLAGHADVVVNLDVPRILSDRQFYPGGQIYFETCTAIAFYASGSLQQR